MISGARKAKYLNVITMFTHSQGNTPLGQSEHARATFLRSRTPTGSHSRQCEYSAHVLTSVRSGRQNATFEVQNRTRDSSIRKFAFGLKIIWSFPIWWLNYWPCFLSHFLRLNFLKCPCGVHVLAIRKYRTSESSVS